MLWRRESGHAPIIGSLPCIMRGGVSWAAVPGQCRTRTVMPGCALVRLALGGPDDPTQMVALCLNCHAVRRGSKLLEVLFATAKRRHEALLKEVCS
jgi:hypothetical protein